MRTCVCSVMATKGPFSRSLDLTGADRPYEQSGVPAIEADDQVNERRPLPGPSLASSTCTSLTLQQKVTAFSRSEPQLIAVGSTNSQLSVLTYPALEEIFPSIEYDGDEIFDTDFDDSGDMVRPASWILRRVLIGVPCVGDGNKLKEALSVVYKTIEGGRSSDSGPSHRATCTEEGVSLHFPCCQVRPPSLI